MNQEVSNGDVYNALNKAADSFFQSMVGSEFWRYRESSIISQMYRFPGIEIKLEMKEFMRPDGKPVLPDTLINPQLLDAGSYWANAVVRIQNEEEFWIHAPHNKAENRVHIQKGGEKRLDFPVYSDNIKDFGSMGSALFLKFCSENQALNTIEKIRNW